jgi:hypothetical protein
METDTNDQKVDDTKTGDTGSNDTNDTDTERQQAQQKLTTSERRADDLQRQLDDANDKLEAKGTKPDDTDTGDDDDAGDDDELMKIGQYRKQREADRKADREMLREELAPLVQSRRQEQASEDEREFIKEQAAEHGIPEDQVKTAIANYRADTKNWRDPEGLSTADQRELKQDKSEQLSKRIQEQKELSSTDDSSDKSKKNKSKSTDGTATKIPGASTSTSADDAEPYHEPTEDELVKACYTPD